jgi:Ser/Thr protein kinase RdoA (MazF antagonist)
VALPQRDRSGHPSHLYEGNRFTLSPFLETGRSWLELDEAGLRRLNANCGAAIGRLHNSLASFPQANLEQRTWRTDFSEPWFNDIIQNIQKHLAPPERKAFVPILDESAVDIQASARGLPEQLIHRDCHHGNIVVQGEQVTGFVDCDHLSLGPRVFDLANFVIHMIKHSVNVPQRTAEWFRLFPAVLQGYQHTNPLGTREQQAVYWMLLGILILFVDWFYKTGSPEKALSDLEAFAWIARNRKQIQTRMEKAFQ